MSGTGPTTPTSPTPPWKKRWRPSLPAPPRVASASGCGTRRPNVTASPPAIWPKRPARPGPCPGRSTTPTPRTTRPAWPMTRAYWICTSPLWSAAPLWWTARPGIKWCVPPWAGSSLTRAFLRTWALSTARTQRRCLSPRSISCAARSSWARSSTAASPSTASPCPPTCWTPSRPGATSSPPGAPSPWPLRT